MLIFILKIKSIRSHFFGLLMLNLGYFNFSKIFEFDDYSLLKVNYFYDSYKVWV